MIIVDGSLSRAGEKRAEGGGHFLLTANTVCVQRCGVPTGLEEECVPEREPSMLTWSDVSDSKVADFVAASCSCCPLFRFLFLRLALVGSNRAGCCTTFRNREDIAARKCRKRFSVSAQV
jgi:hypothetical protein